MNIEPQIINNMNNKSLYANKNVGLSYTQNMTVPKHTLGYSQPQSQFISKETAEVSQTPNYIYNYQAQDKARNADLYGVLEAQSNSFDITSSSHFGRGEQDSYDASSGVKMVKENVSSNIIDSIPSSNLPSIVNKSTTSLGGKTIRINR